MSRYPERIEIAPLRKPPKVTIAVPGSKSITNRALVLAALSDSCEILGALQSEDTEVMVDSLQRLGFHLQADWPARQIRFRRQTLVGRDPEETWIPVPHAELFVANSGTSMRFLTALVSLGHGTFRIAGVARMHERPIEDLLDALQQFGVDARSEGGNGCPPVVVHAHGLQGGSIRVKGDISSQFLSGLMLVAPFASGDSRIEVSGTLVSRPYVVMTVEMMRQLGLQIECVGLTRFVIPGRQRLVSQRIFIEPDASAASYFWAAAAITGGTVTVADLSTESIQGDVRFVRLLEQMGCRVECCTSGVTVHGRALCGIDVDMNDISDTVMTLAVVACFAQGPTTIRNVAHIRHKETDRLAALSAELRKLGAKVDEFADGLQITPMPLQGTSVRTYQDHRMAMSLALVGLRIAGVIVEDPGCVAKTYPEFWTDLERLRGA